tara:strand:- start:244 stop:894 length:651 start_codon:yes stop_codon:yes gene_type:complete
MISQNLKERFLTSFFLIALIVLFTKYDFFLVYTLIVLGVLSVIEFLDITKKITANKLYLLISNLSFVSYIFTFCFLFIFFFKFVQLKILLIILLLVCIASDIGGYIFGKIFKGPKLSKISPNKTVAGAIGSLLLSSLVILLLFYFINEKLNYLTIVVAMITSIFCQLGDLFFSFLKRKANLKNTGNFLPGHGGVLDRLDSILLGIPTGLYSFIIFF